MNTGAKYQFDMPWPPSVNNWHQPIKMGKFIRLTKARKARDYEDQAVEHLKSIGMADENLTGELHVVLGLYPPTLRKYDIDNRTKGVFDALSAANFWEDDSQVTKLTLMKCHKEPPGRVSVSITML